MKKTYQEAKAKCRLTDREIELAKELGISPETLIHNIPGRGEPWKDPVALWLWRMYAKKSL